MPGDNNWHGEHEYDSVPQSWCCGCPTLTLSSMTISFCPHSACSLLRWCLKLTRSQNLCHLSQAAEAYSRRSSNGIGIVGWLGSFEPANIAVAYNAGLFDVQGGRRCWVFVRKARADPCTAMLGWFFRVWGLFYYRSA